MNLAARYTKRRSKTAVLSVFTAMQRAKERKAEAKTKGMCVCWKCFALNLIGTSECVSCGTWLGDMEGNR